MIMYFSVEAASRGPTESIFIDLGPLKFGYEYYEAWEEQMQPESTVTVIANHHLSLNKIR